MYETKALLSLLANSIARAQSVKEAYSVIIEAANVEGVNLPTYKEKLEEIEELRREDNTVISHEM